MRPSINRREECVRMPGKTVRSDPRTPLGRPGMPDTGRSSNLGFQAVQNRSTFHVSSGSSGESRFNKETESGRSMPMTARFRALMVDSVDFCVPKSVLKLLLAERLHKLIGIERIEAAGTWLDNNFML